MSIAKNKHLRAAFDLLVKINPKVTVAVEHQWGRVGLAVYFVAFVGLAVWLRVSGRRGSAPA